MVFFLTPLCDGYVKRLVSLSEWPAEFFPIIYIYIYIYCHPQTDSFVLSEFFSVARHAGRSHRNPSNVTLDEVSDLSATKRTTMASRIFKVFI